MATPRRPHPRLLTKKQVAHLLQCSERTVERLVREKKLDAPYRLGPKLERWSPRQVRKFLLRLEGGDFG